MFKTIKHVRDHVASKLSVSGDSFTYILLCILVIIGPIFFIPVMGFSITTSKGFFVLFIAVLGLLAYGISVLRKGVVSLPRHKIFIMAALVSAAGILGAVLSPSFGTSFFGYGFETTTWLFMTALGLIMFFAYRTIQSYERVGVLYGGIIGAFFVVLALHVVRYVIGPGAITLGVLGGNTATLVGSWSDLGIFFGFVALFCMITLELGGLKSVIKWILGVLGILSVVALAFMHIAIIWIVLGLITLLLALYLFSFAYWNPETKVYRKEGRVPWYTLSLFVIAVVSIFFGGMFNNIANHHQNISWNDVRPSFSMTVRVTEKSWGHNFLTGYGPNMFMAGWAHAKPPAISASNFGNSDFTLGAGYIPTHIASEGILGAVFWIGFFLMLLMLLVQRMGRGFESAMDRYFTISLGVLIVYLSVMAWAYIPGSYLLALLAVLIGAFISVAPSTIASPDASFSFIKDPRASFFGILGIAVVIVVTLFGGYVEARKLISFVHYTDSQVQVAKNNLPGAEKQMESAAAFAPHDIYENALVNFALNDAQKLVASTTAANKATVSKQTEQVIGIALGHAQTAVAENSSSYENWATLGNVYQFMVTLGIAGAYDQATAAYQEAVKWNPNDSRMQLYFAQLAIANSDTAKALGFITDSINQYPTEGAYVLRAQIQISQKDMAGATASIKAAVALDPYNADLSYEYGILLFNQKDYTNAIVAFGHVLLMNKNYGPAYVYLGVSYEYSGDMDDANKIYTYIKQQSPNAAALINQVKNGAPAPLPTQTTTEPATSVPVKAPTPVKKPVAPKTKK